MLVVYRIVLGNCFAWYPHDRFPSFCRRAADLILSESVWMVPGTGDTDD
jgi:hypothetical protein